LPFLTGLRHGLWVLLVWRRGQRLVLRLCLLIGRRGRRIAQVAPPGGLRQREAGCSYQNYRNLRDTFHTWSLIAFDAATHCICFTKCKRLDRKGLRLAWVGPIAPALVDFSHRSGRFRHTRARRRPGSKVSA
jgi:hypothetical protein